MIALTAKKTVSNTLIIEAPKQRGWMPPPTKSHKNRRHDFKNRWHKD